MKTANLIDTILDNLSSTLHQVDSDQIDALQKALLRANRIFIAGKGRTGLQMRAFAMRLMHLGLEVHVVDDVTTPGIAAADLLLIGSGSGRTPSLIRYAETAHARGVEVGAFVGDQSSPIAASANHVVFIPATNFKSGDYSSEKSVLVMGALFEHSLGLICDLIIIRLKAARNVSEEEMNARHANLE
jgi:6-phospho-3-hexuloisomerase